VNTNQPRFEERASAYLAFVVVLAVPFAFTMLLFKEVDQTVRDIVMVLVGVIAANATQAVQHRFGSNPSSQRKDETIGTLASTAHQAQQALAPLVPTGDTKVVPVEPGEQVTVQGTNDSSSPHLPERMPSAPPLSKSQIDAERRGDTRKDDKL
jgi:hypothetical protein